MRTKLLYLDDSYLKEFDATILDVQYEQNGKYRLLLDQTVFYPMGGGQPTDQGILTLTSHLEGGNTQEADIYLVMLKDGEVWHYVSSQTSPAIDQVIHGVINWERRYKNMKVHSAGHVVDFALFVLGYSPKQLMPVKADHGKKPFIVYQGLIEKDIKEELEKKANELVEKDLKFSYAFQPLESCKKEAIYLQPGLPTNKPLRTLRLETIGAVADGGTQVATTKEVGRITIPTIEVQNNSTIIHYALEG